jgi:hypothetical protein
VFYGFQQLRVFLAHDLVELRRPHTGLLQLLERLAGARVTNETKMTDLVIKVNGVRIAARGGNWAWMMR